MIGCKQEYDDRIGHKAALSSNIAYKSAMNSYFSRMSSDRDESSMSNAEKSVKKVKLSEDENIETSKAKLSQWTEIKENGSRSLLLYNSITDSLKVNDEKIKIAAFDLDNTLIITKSGKRFAQNAKDWKLFHPTLVSSTLNSLYKQQYCLVIVSNQLGISQGKASEAEIKAKIEAIIHHINLPMLAMVAISRDRMRKPSPGAWEVLFAQLDITSENVDLSQCFYCGDAAGRPKFLNRPKDFASSDYKFALNCGIAFQTPEKLFLKSKDDIHTCPDLWSLGFDPRKLAESTEVIALTRPDQEVVVLCGSPASGKSFVAKHSFCNYEIVNQDQMKSVNKCKTACENALQGGKSVVIDATNRNISTRKAWIQIAQEHKVSIRCIQMNVDKPLAMHLNKYRALGISQIHVDAIPDIALHTFFKYYEPPNEMEGYSDIFKLDFQIQKDKLNSLERAYVKYFLM